MLLRRRRQRRDLSIMTTEHAEQVQTYLKHYLQRHAWSFGVGGGAAGEALIAWDPRSEFLAVVGCEVILVSVKLVIPEADAKDTN